jgi:3-oxoacyl-[acyl-carrier protein] reductase
VDLRLHGKSVIVTGGTRNLGGEIVKGFLREGALVVTTYREDDRSAEEFLRTISPDQRPNLRVCKLDVSSAASCEQLCRRAYDEFGGVNVLVNNAAVLVTQELSQITDADFDWILQNTLRSCLYMTRAAFDTMSSSGGGRIVNLSTAGVYTANPKEMLYLCAKAGVEASTRAFARLGAPKKVTVNAVAPHVIDSGMGLETLKSDPTIIDRIPLGRNGRQEELVGVVLYLSSEISEYMTGQILHLNGGRLMR